MRVLLATGIFYPDVGGPATHVLRIGNALTERGYDVTVISYGDYSGEEPAQFKVIRISRKKKALLRWFTYLIQVLKNTPSAKVVYAFNVGTAGIPVFIAGKLFRKKIFIRVAGDPVWERVVEGGKRFLPISEYYRKGLAKKDRGILFRMVKFCLPRFDKIVFYTPLLKDLYSKHYGVPEEKTVILPNPVSRRRIIAETKEDGEETILFAGRFVFYKNLEFVVNVFDRVHDKFGRGRLILIGDGPDKEKLLKIIDSLSCRNAIDILPKMDQKALFTKISSCTFGIGPALTEFNPNFILECLSFGKPVLISRENGLSVELPEEFLFDAGSELELEEKMSNFFDQEFRKKSLKLVSELKLEQSWEQVTDFHIRLIEGKYGTTND